MMIYLTACSGELTSREFKWSEIKINIDKNLLLRKVSMLSNFIYFCSNLTE
jgi:hypothetical protein